MNISRALEDIEIDISVKSNDNFVCSNVTHGILLLYRIFVLVIKCSIAQLYIRGVSLASYTDQERHILQSLKMKKHQKQFYFNNTTY